jgi:hypothetical protein
MTGSGYILVNFISNLSGHPDPDAASMFTTPKEMEKFVRFCIVYVSMYQGKHSYICTYIHFYTKQESVIEK